METNAILAKYQIQGDEGPHGMQVSDDASVCSSIASSSVVSAAPSALRKGKYSSSRPSNAGCAADPRRTGIGTPNPQSFGSQSLYNASGEESKNGYSRKKNVKLNDRPHVYMLPQRIESEPELTKLSAHNQLPSQVTLPNGLTLLNSGYIYGRCSRLSILLKKKWKEVVWIHVKPATILIFRNLDDSMKWMNAKFLSHDEKKKIIKLSIDFDTMGSLTPSPSLRVMKLNMMDVTTKRSKLDGSIV